MFFTLQPPSFLDRDNRRSSPIFTDSLKAIVNSFVARYFPKYFLQRTDTGKIVTDNSNQCEVVARKIAWLIELVRFDEALSGHEGMIRRRIDYNIRVET